MGLLAGLGGLFLFLRRGFGGRGRAVGRGLLLAGASGVDRDSGFAGLALVHVGLAVAAADRPRHPHAEIGPLGADPGDTGGAALPRRELAIKRRIAGDVVGSAAGFVEIGGV